MVKCELDKDFTVFSNFVETQFAIAHATRPVHNISSAHCRECYFISSIFRDYFLLLFISAVFFARGVFELTIDCTVRLFFHRAAISTSSLQLLTFQLVESPYGAEWINSAMQWGLPGEEGERKPAEPAHVFYYYVFFQNWLENFKSCFDEKLFHALLNRLVLFCITVALR